ncbi:MAG: aminoacyl-tRNA hydrolase [Pseudomonadota bacterium]
MRLLVGLGNPGPRYAQTRHNIGFMAVDDFVRRHSFGPWRTRFQGLMSEGRLAGDKLLVLKPQTFMNLSGQSVGEVVRFFKLSGDQVFVLYDEIDLVPGKIKVKKGGGAGGHNGIRSIDAAIGPEYWRVRIGVGHPGHKDLVHGYVLSDFAKAEQPMRDKVIDEVTRELPTLLEGDSLAFMSHVAQALKPPRPKPKPKPQGEAPPDAAQADD